MVKRFQALPRPLEPTSAAFCEVLPRRFNFPRAVLFESRKQACGLRKILVGFHGKRFWQQTLGLRQLRAKRISTLIQRLIKKHLPIHFRPDFFVQFFNLARIVGAVESQFYFGLLCALFDH